MWLLIPETSFFIIHIKTCNRTSQSGAQGFMKEVHGLHVLCGLCISWALLTNRAVVELEKVLLTIKNIHALALLLVVFRFDEVDSIKVLKQSDIGM